MVVGIDFRKFLRFAYVESLLVVPLDDDKNGRSRNGFSTSSLSKLGQTMGGCLVHFPAEVSSPWAQREQPWWLAIRSWVIGDGRRRRKLVQNEIFGRSSWCVYRRRSDLLGTPRSKAKLEEVRRTGGKARTATESEWVARFRAKLSGFPATPDAVSGSKMDRWWLGCAWGPSSDEGVVGFAGGRWWTVMRKWVSGKRRETTRERRKVEIFL